MYSRIHERHENVTNFARKADSDRLSRSSSKLGLLSILCEKMTITRYFFLLNFIANCNLSDFLAVTIQRRPTQPKKKKTGGNVEFWWLSVIFHLFSETYAKIYLTGSFQLLQTRKCIKYSALRIQVPKKQQNRRVLRNCQRQLFDPLTFKNVY